MTKPHLAISSAEVCYLSQHTPTLRGPYPASRKLRVLTLLLRTHEEAPQLLGRYPGRPRSAEKVEDEVALPARGHDGAPDEAQGLLGGMVSVTFLPPGHGRDAPDGGDLGAWVWAVYEVVVEGVAGGAPPFPPHPRLVGGGARHMGQRQI